MRWVPSEINNPRKGGILCVGRDPGEEEERYGRPFIGTAGRILDACLAEAGIRRADVNITNVVGVRPLANDFNRHRREDVERGLRELHELLRRLRPSVVVALGNEAAFATIPGWPSRAGDAGSAGVYGACDIEKRRGYIFEGIDGIKVIPAIHPHLEGKPGQAVVSRVWVPWRILLSYDLQRAKEQSAYADVRRPERDVIIVSSSLQARACAEELASAKRLACDIETVGTHQLSCVGFAASSNRAIVFPERYFDDARRVLEAPVAKVFQNGQYDLYFLLTRCGTRVANYADDTIVAWHSCYPELAGAAQNKKGSKRTHKSLAFLASLYTADAWWKEYDFATEEERYVLNGRDCCITLDVMESLEREIRRLGVGEIYRHGISLVWPCVVMQSRGLRVDDALRRTRLEQLQQRILAQRAKLAALAIPLIEARREQLEAARVWHLFEKKEPVCTCCRSAASKRLRCWSCAGFEKAPGKRDLVRAFPHLDATLKKGELETLALGTCTKCEGREPQCYVEFNPSSGDQAKIVLYDLLKLPKKFKDGSLTTNEDALKALLAGVT